MRRYQLLANLKTAQTAIKKQSLVNVKELAEQAGGNNSSGLTKALEQIREILAQI